MEITFGSAASGFWTSQVIVGLIQALITLMAACAVAFFSWRQWITAQDKVKIDLFDRRLEWYRNFLRIRTSHNNNIVNDFETLDAEKSLEWQELARVSRFLFGPEVEYQMMDSFVCLVDESNANFADEERPRYSHGNKRHDPPHSLDFMLEAAKIDGLISNYIQLGHIAVNKAGRFNTIKAYEIDISKPWRSMRSRPDRDDGAPQGEEPK